MFTVLEERFTVVYLLLTSAQGFQLKVEQQKLLVVPEIIAVTMLRPIIVVLTELTEIKLSFLCLGFLCFIFFFQMSGLPDHVCTRYEINKLDSSLCKILSLDGRAVDLSSFKQF